MGKTAKVFLSFNLMKGMCSLLTRNGIQIVAVLLQIQSTWKRQRKSFKIFSKHILVGREGGDRDRRRKRHRSKHGGPIPKHGAKVVIADIQDNVGQALADNIGGDIAYIHCDVTDEDQVRALVDTTVAKFGRLDIMYSNAGIMTDGSSGSILNAAKDALERTLGVNLVGAFLAAKEAARVMVLTKKGCIIFTASACTEIAGIAEHAYVASKYGIVGLTKSLTAELGLHGIRVNCVSPFGVVTGRYADDEMRKTLDNN